MPLSVPVATPQLWLFELLSLPFLVLVIRAILRRPRESGATRATRSRLGIFIQGFGIAFAGFGPVRFGQPWLGLAAVASYAAIVLCVGGAVALFASSSMALGKNWSFEARTLADHELIRSGPYARVRHPIYLGMLLFLLGMAVALGHWLQLLLAIPLFVIGTRIRTQSEDRLLEQSFGEAFRDYRRATPALFPKII